MSALTEDDLRLTREDAEIITRRMARFGRWAAQMQDEAWPKANHRALRDYLPKREERP